MSYPTMPRPTDNTGGNHRAAITALEEAIQRNQARGAEEAHARDLAKKALLGAQDNLDTLEAERAALRRGIEALKAADQ